MNTETSDQKINDFLKLLRSRTINRIRVTDIKDSCTASLLLIFAAIDSMSKITCIKDDYTPYVKNKMGVRVRFMGFLKDVMRGDYAKEEVNSRLYNLRCDIVHTGIGTGVTLSRHDDAPQHLKEIDSRLWIHTPTLLADFEAALDRICADFEARGQYYQNASVRLRDFTKVVDIDDAMPSEAPDELFQ